MLDNKGFNKFWIDCSMRISRPTREIIKNY